MNRTAIIDKKDGAAKSLTVHLDIRINAYTNVTFNVDYPSHNGNRFSPLVWVKARKCPATDMVRSGAPCSMEFPDNTITHGTIQEIVDDRDSLNLLIERTT